MARIRSIKPSFFTSQTIAELSDFRSRLGFAGLWTHADDEGRCIDNPRLIKAALFPLDDVSSADMEGMLSEWHASKLIIRYQVEDRQYLAVTNWKEHQVVNRPTPSKYPSPNDPGALILNALSPPCRNKEGNREGKEPLPPSSNTETARDSLTVVETVLEAMTHVEYGHAGSRGRVPQGRGDRYRAGIRLRLGGEWATALGLAASGFLANAEAGPHPHDVATVAFDQRPYEHAFAVKARLLGDQWIDPMQLDSASDFEASGATETGPTQPSKNGVSSSSKTASKTPRRLSSVSDEPTESSPPSPSGERPTEPSAGDEPTATLSPNSPGKDQPMPDEPPSPKPEPSSPEEDALREARIIGASLGRAMKPRNDLDKFTADMSDAARAVLVEAWAAEIPERRRYENIVYQLDHVRDDGQVFTVKVHQNGVVTGLRADFPADVWRSAELVDA